ncbi:MAG TPA: DUF6259 domain-containing protein [Bryobacteraceae bacterium]|jgi:hypothetical protein|nr:DUF6259 domain-containing protein [Bryobacteraceae bacterium]
MCSLPLLTIVLTLLASGSAAAEPIVIGGPALKLEFTNDNSRLLLVQMRKGDDRPLLFRDGDGKTPGPGPVGNPFAIVIRNGPHKGQWGPASFRVLKLQTANDCLIAYLAHDELPLALILEVSVEGSVATWRGQVLWNGSDPVEIDTYLPLFSRTRFSSPQTDRLLTAEVSGMALNSLGDVNFSDAYIGSLSAPLFLVEGGGRGLAVVDQNRAEYAADPGDCALRGQVVGNTFPISDMPWDERKPKGGASGPFIGIRYTRWFRSISEAGGEAEWAQAEKVPDTPPVRKLGDAVDIGPVRTYAYHGSWQNGGLWLRHERSSVLFRASAAEWYRNNTFISEDMGDRMLKAGESFYDYAKVLANKQRMGSDLFAIPGFSEPEILGSTANFLNRGDYIFPAGNLGGLDAEREGIAALHRQNGHLLYYVEGLIVWKRSRIGRTWARDWAIMNEDGTFSESYKGFYDMCPAAPGWQEWLAKTLAQIVKDSNVDGFFIDSLTATNNHRCFNPAHHHPHPDVWTWGVRQLLARVRGEVDRVNPSTVLFTEGEADLAREFTDGFITHSAFWNHGTFTEPLLRFIYPPMKAYESWGYGKNPQRNHIFNAVNGEYIYAHDSETDIMAPISLATRHVYNAYPEITHAQMLAADLACTGCIAALFDGGNGPILTVGNSAGTAVNGTVKIPASGTVLFDRVTGVHIEVENGQASIPLQGWEFRAFEIRP